MALINIKYLRIADFETFTFIQTEFMAKIGLQGALIINP
jgi:hypothetical protein